MDTLPNARGGLLIEQVGEEMLIYDEAAGRVHIVNETALLVWGRCDGQTSLEQMTELLTNQFAKVSPDQVRQDVERIVEGFRDEGLFE